MLKPLKTVIKSFISPYKPLLKNKEIWDKEYAAGKWNFLNDTKDSLRHNIIADYIRDKFDNSVSILDLGCGTGILQLKFFGYHSYYTGVDISDEAIILAKSREDENNKFHQDDLMNFTPDRIYDCIIFNESLYYFEEPLKLINKYSPFLSKNGIFVISMWNNKERNNKLWKSINSTLDCVEGVHLKLDSGNSWYIRFYHKIVSLYLIVESSILDLYFLQGDLPLVI